MPEDKYNSEVFTFSVCYRHMELDKPLTGTFTITGLTDKMDAFREANHLLHTPVYGEIFCRCEKVTKAEILQAIHNPLGVRTVNGVKVRTRATMGRCQGGYCETRITEALHQELGEDFRDIHLGPEGS